MPDTRIFVKNYFWFFFLLFNFNGPKTFWLKDYAAEKEGLYVKYRLADEMVCEFFRTMRVLAENRLAEVDMIKRRFLEGREGMEPVNRVNRNDLLKRVIEGGVTVLDVRPAEEYKAGHIPGALSVPFGHLKELLSKLPMETVQQRPGQSDCG